jgi:hypothetical protein
MPYYADRTVEFVANVPYLITSTPEKTLLDQISADDRVCVIWIKHLVNYTSLAHRIKAANPASKFMVYIFIHPLPNTANGLYWIRILVPPFGNTPAAIVASQRLNENALVKRNP